MFRVYRILGKSDLWCRTGLKSHGESSHHGGNVKSECRIFLVGINLAGERAGILAHISSHAHEGFAGALKFKQVAFGGDSRFFNCEFAP